MIYFEHKGIMCPIDIEHKDLPQDGQRIRLLEKKAEEWYNNYKRLLIYSENGIIDVVNRWIEYYTEKFGFLPKSIDLYPFCLNVVHDNWSDEIMKKITYNNLSEAVWLYEIFDSKVKILMKRYEDYKKGKK